MPLIGVNVTDELAERIEEARWRRRMNKSEYIRQAIETAVSHDMGSKSETEQPSE